MNIVLITVDTLRADHVGCYGYERDTTPNIDKLSTDSHRFSQTVAHACATRPSFPSILTSTHGMLYGGFDHLSEEQVPLSVPFSGAGYATGGFHSNPYLSAEFGYNRGFDTFSDSEEDPTLISQVRRYASNNIGGRLHNFLSWAYDKTEEHAGVDVGSYYQDASSLTDEALAWTDSVSEPWFLWIHYMDPHHPYIPPEEHQVFGETHSRRHGVKLRQKVLDDPGSLSDEDWSDLIDLYDAEIRYTDTEIGRLLNKLDDVCWALTADHGEEFYEHGNFGHKNRFYEEHVHVPFLLGGTADDGVHDSLVGLNDVPVTLLREAGIDTPDTYRGQDARSSNRDRVLGGWSDDVGRDPESARLMSRTGDEKYIRDESEDGEELYNLLENQSEQTNLAKEADLDEHILAIKNFRDEIRKTSRRADAVGVSSDLEEQLEHLGYK